jgi:hypothetical protein
MSSLLIEPIKKFVLSECNRASGRRSVLRDVTVPQSRDDRDRCHKSNRHPQVGGTVKKRIIACAWSARFNPLSDLVGDRG